MLPCLMHPFPMHGKAIGGSQSHSRTLGPLNKDSYIKCEVMGDSIPQEIPELLRRGNDVPLLLELEVWVSTLT